MNADSRDDVHDLMMAAFDGELGPEERRELDARLEADPRLKAEWERLGRLKEVISMSQIKTPPDEQWKGYWRSVYNRIERGFGWILVSLGVTVLVGFGLWQATNELLGDTEVPLFIKLAIFSLSLGGVILLVSVLREKLFTYRHDPYKEVER